MDGYANLAVGCVLGIGKVARVAAVVLFTLAGFVFGFDELMRGFMVSLERQ